MKTIYCIGLDYDMGEYWLDEKFNLLHHIHCNDASWRGEYHNFIIEYFGGKIVEICYAPTDEESDKIRESGDYEDGWNIIKKNVLKQLKAKSK